MYHEAAKISRERFYGFYPFRNSFYRTQVYLGSDLWVRVSLTH